MSLTFTASFDQCGKNFLRVRVYLMCYLTSINVLHFFVPRDSDIIDIVYYNKRPFGFLSMLFEITQINVKIFNANVL